MRKSWKWWLVGGLLVLVLVGTILAVNLNGQPRSVQANIVGLPAADSGFARVVGPKALVFPQDFGPHPGYQTEWWYYTGNLDAQDGRHFGYQLTFFRRAAAGPQDQIKRSSDWSANQIYLAHFALTDVSANRFQSFERVERGAAGLAGAQGGPGFQVWLDDWRLRMVGSNTFQLTAAQGDIHLDLTLQDHKGVILEGDRGYSQKGLEPGNASTYFSQTRLISAGTLQRGGEKIVVSGLSWMDHEFSTSALSRGQVGWDWFALQLSDGNELMVYRIRQENGSTDPFSSGTWIAADGSTSRVDLSAVQIDALGSWRSPHSKGIYPAGWRVRIPSRGLDLQIQAYIADQENHLTFTYWEGAVKISGSSNGKAVSGAGYVELTGYAGSLAGQF